MTIATCFRCGTKKWGALNPCDKCGSLPNSADDIAISIFLSDHYFSKDTLERIGLDISNGKKINFDENSRKILQKLSQEANTFQGNKKLNSNSTWRNVMGIFGKLFGKKQDKWYMVADWVRQGNIYLVGLKRTLEIEEAAFGGMLIAAKINGWSGGNEFFIISNGDGVLKQIEDGMSILGQEASELGIKFIEFTKKNERGSMEEDFFRICMEGYSTPHISDHGLR